MSVYLRMLAKFCKSANVIGVFVSYHDAVDHIGSKPEIPKLGGNPRIRNAGVNEYCRRVGKYKRSVTLAAACQ